MLLILLFFTVPGKPEVKNKSVTKGLMKIFNQKDWNLCLAKQPWELLGETVDLNKMVEGLNYSMTEALDEIAPVKTFIIRPDYKKV